MTDTGLPKTRLMELLVLLATKPDDLTHTQVATLLHNATPLRQAIHRMMRSLPAEYEAQKDRRLSAARPKA
jgi:hypothetical protein